MVISEIQPGEIILECLSTLGLSPSADAAIDDRFIASMLRRSAGINCPCSRTTLRASLVECLQYLSQDEISLSDRIDDAIEGLIVGGDLLELSDIATDDPAVKGTWVFSAPPSFIVRPSGSIFILGIVPDQDVFLPLSLSSRIIYEGFTRVMVTEPNEDLGRELEEEGLQRLSEGAWLKSPKNEPPDDMINRFGRQLTSQPRSGTVTDIQILDPQRSVFYYRKRWIAPKKHTGTFVARRPQEFGAPIWCYVALEEGVVVKFIDLPLKKTIWRGCDVAWHLQMAIDYSNHNPQLYRRKRDGDGVRLEFFSPLPEWFRRRLMIFGRPASRDNCLVSYWLPNSEAETEERFLQERLWLSRSHDSDQE